MSIRKKLWLTFLAILVLTILAGLVDWPHGPDLNLYSIRIPYEKELKVHLGLDLQGGTHLVYEADLSKVEPENYESAMAGVRDVIERRVNIMGVSEPVVQTVKTDEHYRLIVELAGIKDVRQAIEMIGQTPSLDFRELIEDEQGDEDNEAATIQESPISTEKSEGEEAKIIDKEEKSINAEKLQKQLEEQQKEILGFPGFKMTKLGGQHLTKAQLQFDPQTNLPQVGLEFNNEGKKLFAEITERNVGKPVGIFLDGQPISIPQVKEPIREGKAVISGDFTIKEAKELAMRLNAGALPVPIKLISQQTVGATLGKVSVEKSFLAGILGLILVCLFMIFYYRLPGFLACFSLTIYTLIVFALFKLIPVTLTLAGVAGFILSIGMAVDANILIFERIKEKLREEGNLPSAIEEGFKHAWSSIRDSNISTIITCAILVWFGVSILKGFGITLGIGVLISMFSAIVVTRTFLRLFAGKRIEKRSWLFGINT